MQDLAMAANEVLPPEVPESGTMTRYLWSRILEGASMGGVGMEYGGMAGRMTGGALLTGAGAGTLYTGPGMRVLNKVATGIPKAAGTVNQALPFTGFPASISDLAEQMDKSK